jgi:O-acetylhomoserine (thiol)-lyase
MQEDRLPGFATLAVHAGVRPEAEPRGRSAHTVTTLDAFGGIPLRADSPAVAALEEKIAAIEGGTAAVCVPSANAALALVFHALLQPGDEFIAARPLADDVAAQFRDAFPRFGWAAQWADLDDRQSVENAISPRTKAIFVESAAEAGAVADLAAIASVAHRARVPLVVDNSLATAYLCRPLDHADIVIHTRAALLGGTADIAGGAIVDGGAFDWSEERRYPLLSEPLAERGNIVLCETFGNVAFAMACRVLGLGGIGAEMLPSTAERILSGIETLPLRMQRHSDNARAIAAWLAGREGVRWVSYPGLPGDRYHNLSRQYQPNGAGPIVNFAVDGEAAEIAMSRLQLISPMAAAGGTRSGMRRLGSTSRASSAVVVRIWVGIEDRDDLVADLEQAFAAA